MLHLQHGLHAPARARHWLRGACLAWGCPELSPDAVTLVSELTTNAVLHAGTDCWVEADFDDLALTVRVSDESPAPPAAEVLSLTAERGRGLAIVDGLANAWGVTPTATGKTIWFALWSPDRAEPGPRMHQLDHTAPMTDS